MAEEQIQSSTSPRVEIVSESEPIPRASGKSGMSLTLRLIDSKTGEEVSKTTSQMYENERREREERKY